MEYFLIAALILLGSYFSFLSAVLSSLKQENLNKIIDSGHPKAEVLHHLKLHYDDLKEVFLVIEIFLYTGAIIFYIILINNHLSNNIYLIIPFLLFPIFILLLRTVFWGLGSRFADIIALPLTSTFNLLNIISKPFNKLLIVLIEKVSGKGQEEASREELNALVETAHEEGSIETDEYRILKNIMHFNDVLVTDVMTPRTVVFSCNADLTVEEIINLPELQLYSRFPIWEGESLDDGIVGYVMSKDVLHAALSGQSKKKLRAFYREVYIIPESAELDNALEQFLQRRQHLSVVVDEYGGVEGLITMEDVLETILGVEIVDEADKVVDMREAAKLRRDKRVAMLIVDDSKIER